MIERLENLISALEMAVEDLQLGSGPMTNAEQNAVNKIDTASGIAGEILTMIDGR